ncbi:hypothetical protein EVAR_87399_1 [Eumeta japonica]|uniref:Uncharacterized protein n=1 Tax=Eumeta variegata TaxID=151549 RepID=A0A4C1Y3J5_EUMVA|nr:hypothetical protein EVAR_87399_1 [Eumeta japonica]
MCWDSTAPHPPRPIAFIPRGLGLSPRRWSRAERNATTTSGTDSLASFLRYGASGLISWLNPMVDSNFEPCLKATPLTSDLSILYYIIVNKIQRGIGESFPALLFIASTRAQRALGGRPYRWSSQCMWKMTLMVGGGGRRAGGRRAPMQLKTEIWPPYDLRGES